MAQNDKPSSHPLRVWVIGGSILLVAVIAFFIIRSFYLSQPPGGGNPPLAATPISSEGTSALGGGSAQLTIRLGEGRALPQAYQPLPVATGEPLSAAEIAAILLRLPALTPVPGEQVDFRLPEDLLPPPLAGETISKPFPPPPPAITPETVESGPLQVLRYSPEGEIPIAPFVNITFNQPMVPLATIEDLAAEDVPATIEPALEGTWRWLGTKTLNFQYDSSLIDRLPMATQYTVTVPAGTTSATGGVLAEQVQFSFSTPPVTMQNYYPSYDPQPLEPVFFVSFDQRIDPQAVLETIRVTAGGNPVRVKLATEAEIEADKTVSQMAENAAEGRWLAFKAVEPLPADTSIQVAIGPGTPSAEGPLVTTAEQSFSFYTYAPLRIDDYGCSWWDDDCRPLVPFFIEFNNPIDTLVYDESMLSISPEIPGATVNIFGDTISISGDTQGQTTYKITIAAEIQDIFGQTLGKDEQITIKVGPAEPFLVGPEDIFVTLDPAARKPVLSLFVMNYSRLDVKIYAVQPSDWPAFQEYLQEYQYTDRPSSPPGRLVRDETLRLETATDKLTEVSIDLSDELDGDFGQFIIIVKPPKGLFEEERYWEHVQVWVQVTQIGLDAFVDQDQMVVWATALQDGAPLKGVSVQSDTGSNLATTDADGLARFAIPAAGTKFLVAKKGSDQSILPASTYYWYSEGWSRRGLDDQLRWYVFDDRQMYRPGEEVHLKGWLRLLGGGPQGDVGLPGPRLTAINYRIFDPQGNDLGSGRAEANAWGGFDFSFTLPGNANLGSAYIQMDAEAGALGGITYYHYFQIQEFRRPEFEVNVRSETAGPYFVGDSATLAVEAKYYAGGPLPNAEVTWQVSYDPTNYAPPNWPDFTFGIWEPWWWFSYEYGSDYSGTGYQAFNGVTDATGNHYLKLDFESAQGLRPFFVLGEATVMDVNRQAWTGSTSLLVHPASLYVGLRSDRYFVERGTPLEIELIVTDLDGDPVADRPIKVTAARLEWKYTAGSWQEQAVDPQECTVGSAIEPVTCTFQTPAGGRYQVTAVVSDEMGRENMSQLTRWVSGGELPPAREVEQEEATLIPDKETYQPGDVAEILVQSPFSPAEGLLTVSRSGLLYTERFTIEAGSVTLEVPIEEAYIPNLNIQVDLVGSAARTDDDGNPLPDVPERPAYASGSLSLGIPPLQRTLSLDVNPMEAELEPGGGTTLDLLLKDASGKPVEGAELVVVVVDEAVLALTNYQLADPLAVFYTSRSSDVQSTYARASIVLANPLDILQTAEVRSQAADMAYDEAMPTMTAQAAPMEEPAAAGGEAESAAQAIRIRLDFNPLATFAPEVRTDANGHATVEVSLPDNLTRYRVMVVAVDSGGGQFGSGEAAITARLPLMVRPSAPRFLNFGDQFELPIVLQNQTDSDMLVDVVVEATNITLTGNSGMRVTVPANDRVEVRFPATTDMAGTARLRIAAVSGSYADAATVELPVYTPATTEAFATYGVIDDGAIRQPVASPTGVFPQFGGLEVQTSSTALQALTDAVLYLVAYPFECSEQLSSRILGVAALRDVLTAFEAEGLPSAAEMEAAVERDIARLQAMQNWDGGFPYWRRGQESIPFNTIHVAHALQRAELKGYTVPASMQEQLLVYLQNIESYYPHWYDQQTRWTLSAYALYVRDLMNDSDPAKARQLIAEAGLESLPLEAVGWVWQVLVNDPNSVPELEAIRRHVANQVVETAGAANFTTTYSDQTYLLLSSDRRTDAILLDVLIADDPDSDLIPKLVNGLLAHRTRGRWGNTQENVFVLLALDRYFNTYEAQAPDFVARIWLGETYAGEHIYEGYTTERHSTEIPMAYLVDPELGGGETQDLILSKTGTGRLYYRLGLRYAPTDLELAPLDMGFIVQRVYEAVDDPDDVWQDENGAWHIKAGARVRIRLTMVADNRRYHVALVDPLPAGLEIVNPALAVTGTLPQDPNSPDYHYGWWWWGTWYEHQNLRDERAEAFASLLWDGVYEYTYIARATTPGTFVVPPAKAEEMYSPEVFGRSSSNIVIVK